MLIAKAINTTLKTALLVLVLSQEAMAQVNQLVIALEGGPSSTMVLAVFPDVNRLYRYSAGFSFKCPIKKRWAFKTGAYYRPQGFKLTTTGYDPQWNEYVYKIQNLCHYASVPLKIQYTFGNKIQPYVGVGWYLAYLMRTTQRGGGLPGHTPLVFKIKPNPQVFDFGWAMDAGVRTNLNSKWSVYAELSANLGVFRYKSVSDILPFLNTAAYFLPTQAFGLNFGLGYSLSKA